MKTLLAPPLHKTNNRKYLSPFFPPEQKSCISLRSERELLVVWVSGGWGAWRTGILV